MFELTGALTYILPTMVRELNLRYSLRYSLAIVIPTDHAAVY
jgi:hypothetical protein